MRIRSTTCAAFFALAVLLPIAACADEHLWPTNVAIGECVPPYIYAKASAYQDRLNRKACLSEHPENTAALMTCIKASTPTAIPFFAVDCNSESTLFIGINGIQYSIKPIHGKSLSSAKFPENSYEGAGIKVDVRIGKLISSAHDKGEILNEEYEAWVTVSADNQTQRIHGVYRTGP